MQKMLRQSVYICLIITCQSCMIINEYSLMKTVRFRLSHRKFDTSQKGI